MKTKIFKAKLKDLKPTENNPRQISKDDFRKLKLKLKDIVINKNGNSIKATCDKNGFISKDYGRRSKIPELALKDFFEQAISYMEGKNG